MVAFKGRSAECLLPTTLKDAITTDLITETLPPVFNLFKRTDDRSPVPADRTNEAGGTSLFNGETASRRSWRYENPDSESERCY